MYMSVAKVPVKSCASAILHWGLQEADKNKQYVHQRQQRYKQQHGHQQFSRNESNNRDARNSRGANSIGDSSNSRYVSNRRDSTLQGKSHLCIPFLGIAQPQSQFPHSCFCERFIYSQNQSTYFPAAEQADQSWKYINLSQIYECRNWETEHINSVLEITFSIWRIHKWEPDIYIGFSAALHFQCSKSMQRRQDMPVTASASSRRDSYK